MTRLPFITETELDDDQRKIWDGLVSTRGAAALNSEGGLVGPFNAMIHAPEVGARVSSLGAALRFRSSLPANLLEIAIITVGAHWKSNFEFWAHSRMALEAGVDAAVVDAIRNGEDPVFANADEAAVHAMTRSLLRSGRADDATYLAVVESLGDKATVELTTLIGYYCLISLTLNNFEVELPNGRDPIWPTSAA